MSAFGGKAHLISDRVCLVMTRCGHVPCSNWLARARRCGRNGGEIDAAERHNPSQRMEPSERLAQQQDAERCTKDRKQIPEMPRGLRADSHYAKIPTRETHDARLRGLISARAPAHGGEIFLGAVGAFAMDSFAARAWGGQSIAPRRLRFSAGPRLLEPHARSCSHGF